MDIQDNGVSDSSNNTDDKTDLTGITTLEQLLTILLRFIERTNTLQDTILKRCDVIIAVIDGDRSDAGEYEDDDPDESDESDGSEEDPMDADEASDDEAFAEEYARALQGARSAARAQS